MTTELRIAYERVRELEATTVTAKSDFIQHRHDYYVWAARDRFYRLYQFASDTDKAELTDLGVTEPTKPVKPAERPTQPRIGPMRVWSGMQDPTTYIKPPK